MPMQEDYQWVLHTTHVQEDFSKGFAYNPSVLCIPLLYPLYNVIFMQLGLRVTSCNPLMVVSNTPFSQ